MAAWRQAWRKTRVWRLRQDDTAAAAGSNSSKHGSRRTRYYDLRIESRSPGTGTTTPRPLAKPLMPPQQRGSAVPTKCLAIMPVRNPPAGIGIRLVRSNLGLGLA